MSSYIGSLDWLPGTDLNLPDWSPGTDPTSLASPCPTGHPAPTRLASSRPTGHPAPTLLASPRPASLGQIKKTTPGLPGAASSRLLLLRRVFHDELRGAQDIAPRRLPVVETRLVDLSHLMRIIRDALIRRLGARRRLDHLRGDFAIRLRRRQEQLHRLFLDVHHHLLIWD